MVLSPVYLMQMEWPSWDCSKGWQLHFNYRADGFGTSPDGRVFLEKETHSLLCRFSLWWWLTKPDRRQKWWGRILIPWILFCCLTCQFSQILSPVEKDAAPAGTLTNEGERMRLEKRKNSFSPSSSFIIIVVTFPPQNTFISIIPLNTHDSLVTEVLLSPF